MPLEEKKEKVLRVTLSLALISVICLTIGTATTHWIKESNGDQTWTGYGTFCRNTGTNLTFCLFDFIDPLCVVSILLLVSVVVALVLHLATDILSIDIVRLIVVAMLFVASILLLAIISSTSITRYPGVGFSQQLIITSCAFAKLLLLISGVRLGGMSQSESSGTLSNYTERRLNFLSRGVMVFVALFTIVGMATKEWVGYHTPEGWLGAGTFCRQPPSRYPDDGCVIRTLTTILSVVASSLSLVGLAAVVCAILNLIAEKVERIILTMISLLVSVILWSTIVTVTDLSLTGYSLRLVMAAGPFAQLSLFFGGIWLSISRDANEPFQR